MIGNIIELCLFRSWVTVWNSNARMEGGTGYEQLGVTGCCVFFLWDGLLSGETVGTGSEQSSNV